MQLFLNALLPVLSVLFLFFSAVEDLDVKSLLVEAYHKGQQELLYVVPFIAKVLESCAKSRVSLPLPPACVAPPTLLCAGVQASQPVDHGDPGSAL